jgi:hypothetical protein
MVELRVSIDALWIELQAIRDEVQSSHLRLKALKNSLREF